MRLTWLCLLALAAIAAPAAADERKFLFAEGLTAFRPAKTSAWEEVESVTLDPANPRKLIAKPGKGVWYNGPKGIARDLFTIEKFGDVEVHLEFLIAKRSNSGIKFHGHYEIQIDDSHERRQLNGEHCGGVYPRAELKPSYKHIDKGIPPLVNACKPAGEWQTLDAVFLAPRFDDKGKKIANARLTKVVLNGKTIHDNADLLTPTGHLWKSAEMTDGPIMLQGDHGPVAFRNVWVQSLKK